MVWVERTVETVEQDKQPQTGDARARPPARSQNVALFTTKTTDH